MREFLYDRDAFQTILQMSQAMLKKYLAKLLHECGYKPVSKKGFLYAEGTVPVLLVAHLDTVHRELPDIICCSADGRYLMSPQGIGGDDRCGVYMITQLMQELHCHVLFCEDEEIGGVGARLFEKSGIRPEINFIIEIDRHGSNDAVFYDCDNRLFTEFVLDYGFEKESGSFSDISVIAPYLDTAAVNISAGYLCEHRPQEYIDTQAMLYNVCRIAEMIQSRTEHFPYQKKRLRRGQLSLFEDRYGFRDTNERRERLLMPLPEKTCLLMNGCMRRPNATYMMDSHNNVYFYLDELGAVVESEHTYACDESGDAIEFCSLDAQRLPVLPIETALEKLTVC